jgi:cell fate regulator YaaT (PSP1 superfamily)
MAFLPLYSVAIPSDAPSAADSIAPSLQTPRSGCSSCAAPETHSPDTPTAEPSELVEVEFKGRRRLLCSNPARLPLRLRELVLVTSPHGIDAGHVSALGATAQRKQALYYNGAQPQERILRRATPQDQQQYERNRREELELLLQARQLAKSFPTLASMKLTDAEWQWDRRRLTLYFTAPQRVDFRGFVRTLAQRFKTRVELRQIPAREETRRLGGLGPCGRELCCATFLVQLKPVSLQAARIQQLSMNLLRLSGLCGRLKCCLLYELDFYREALQHYPPLNAIVHTDAGPAKIVKLDLLQERVQLQLQETGALLTLTHTQLQELRAQGRIELPSTPAPPETPPSEPEEESLPPEEELE